MRWTQRATAGVASAWHSRRTSARRRRDFFQTFVASSSRSAVPSAAVGGVDDGQASGVKEWVVFSDLHVSRQTCDVALQVLAFVNAEAQRRNAGVIFLGDFWHARGNLPVEPLNAVLEEFDPRKWTQPTIMITGNHDQVNLGGSVHSLEPIAKASSNVSVFSEPCVFMDALWIPYRRRKEEIEEVLQMHKDEVKAIFAHVDIVGADFNEVFQSTQGLHPSLFPKAIPTYSGHYHKPHTVRGTNIHYVGNQYQLSFGEQNQSKFIQVLDKDWEVVDKIPIDVGPRHFTLNAEMDLTPTHLRRGDRVRYLNCTEEQMQEFPETLRKLGVSSDVLPRHDKEKLRVNNVDQMQPLALFQVYAEQAKLTAQAQELGLGLLSEVESGIKSIRSSHVELESIELDGYGPFQNSVQYDIHRDGMPRIRVISGENVDDLGSTSNGSGKTSLVMAPIWAFTGRTEMKGEHSWRKRTLANRDVVNDDCKNARVFVRGKINEVPFELERIVTKTTLKKLSFVYGGEDLTCQEARLTQEKIDSLVNTRLLARIICHDHDHINALLTANDRQMKEELGIIVDLEFWAAAKSVSSTKLREAKEILNNAASEEQISRRVLSNSSSHLQKCDAEYSNWEQSTVRRTDQLRSTLHHYESNQAGARDNLRGLLKAARAAIREVGSPSSCSSSDGFKDGNEIVDQVSASLQDQERSIKDLEDSLNALIPRRIDVEKSLSAVSYALKDSTKRFKSFSTLGESNTLVCERCNQEIDEQSYKEHLSEFHSDMEAKQRDQDKFVQSKKEVLDKEQVIRNRLRQEKEKYSRVQGELASKAASLGMERQMQESLLEKIRMFIHSCKDFGLEAESEVEMVEKKSESQSKANLSDLCSLIESGTKIFQTSQKLIDDTKQQMEVLKRQKNPFEVTMESLKKQKEQEEESVDLYEEKVQLYASQVDLLSQVDSAFSTSGVQSFAIEGALKQLQELTTANLEILSSNSLKLQLNATKKTKSKAALNSELESINKAIFSRNADGKFVPRNLPQLSGGERRRLGISLALGFSKLASVRSGLHCDLLVLDEVMQHLDDEGCKRLLTLIHTIPNSTVLLVAQPHTAAYDLVDAKDVVKKERNTASVARLY